MFCVDILNCIFFYLKNKDAEAFLSTNKENWSLRQKVTFEEFCPYGSEKDRKVSSVIVNEHNLEIFEKNTPPKNVRRLKMKAFYFRGLDKLENMTEISIINRGEDMRIVFFQKNLKILNIISDSVEATVPDNLEELYVVGNLRLLNTELKKLKRLFVHGDFSSNLSYFPESLTSLDIFGACHSLPDLPSKIIKVSLSRSYSKKIPLSVKKLEFQREGNVSDLGNPEILKIRFTNLGDFKIPNSVKKLEITEILDHSLRGVIPDSVEKLKLTDFTYNVGPLIPKNVKKLTLYAYYGDVKIQIPETIKTLIYYGYGFEIKGSLKNLEKLCVQNFKKITSEGLISVKTLKISCFSKGDLDVGRKFPFLEKFDFYTESGEFRIRNLPQTLKKLFLRNKTSWPLGYPKLPNLEKLLLNIYFFDILFVSLFPSLKTLVLTEFQPKKDILPKYLPENIKKVICFCPLKNGGKEKIVYVRKNDKFV